MPEPLAAEAADPGRGGIGSGLQGAFLGGFLQVLGAELGVVTGDRVTMTMTVTPRLLQPNGIVHGGVHCSIVETLASIGAAVWLGEARGHVVGVANHTDFIRATRTGTLHGAATPIHRGRTQQLWLVEITDQDPSEPGARLIARGEVRLANIASTDQLAGGPVQA